MKFVVASYVITVLALAAYGWALVGSRRRLRKALQPERNRDRG